MNQGRAPIRAAAALASAVLLAGGLAACTSDSSGDIPERVSPAPELPEPPPPPPPVVELTPEEQEAVDEAKDVFELFMASYPELLIEGADIYGVGTFERLPNRDGPMEDDPHAELDDNLNHNRRGEGLLDWRFVEVAEVDLDHTIELPEGGEWHMPLVRLRYCVDATAWQIVDAVSGQPVEPSEHRVLPRPGERHLVTATVRYRGADRDSENRYWALFEWINQEDQPC